MMTTEQAQGLGFRRAGEPRIFQPITQAEIEGRIAESAGASPRGPFFVSARARDPRAMVTSIIADTGENLAYQTSLQRGEYGLQRPLGSNVPGPDFITATREFVGEGPEQPLQMRASIYLNDAKISGIPQFPTPPTEAKATWLTELESAIAPGRLDLGDQLFEQAIRDAVAEGRVFIRQVEIDYSSGVGVEGRVRFRASSPATSTSP